MRIFQRCPHYTKDVFLEPQQDPSQILLMIHPDGITIKENAARIFTNRIEHNPTDLNEARDIADHQDLFPIGLFYKNKSAHIYDTDTQVGLGKSAEDKLNALEAALDHFSV